MIDIRNNLFPRVKMLDFDQLREQLPFKLISLLDHFAASYGTRSSQSYIRHLEFFVTCLCMRPQQFHAEENFLYVLLDVEGE